MQTTACRYTVLGKVCDVLRATVAKVKWPLLPNDLIDYIKIDRSQVKGILLRFSYLSSILMMSLATVARITLVNFWIAMFVSLTGATIQSSQSQIDFAMIE
ncbi:hypothetical protein V1478_012656 [Vespula squamosa]|uniref:Uncharacterized protein n=1 Tax=Vespula squamosa TaxID=30214 RepID=A0ABD2A8M2_VESSQ